MAGFLVATASWLLKYKPFFKGFGVTFAVTSVYHICRNTYVEYERMLQEGKLPDRMLQEAKLPVCPACGCGCRNQNKIEVTRG